MAQLKNKTKQNHHHHSGMVIKIYWKRIMIISINVSSHNFLKCYSLVYVHRLFPLKLHFPDTIYKKHLNDTNPSTHLMKGNSPKHINNESAVNISRTIDSFWKYFSKVLNS